jgi:patatin-like phospholipase/acyl hydrolase
LVRKFMTEPGSRPVFVLAIDGGGVRGLIPAVVLERLEALIFAEADAARVPRPSLARCFDLVAGASTGAILALGIVAPEGDGDPRPLLSAGGLVDLYRNRSPAMFVKGRLHRLRMLIAPRYDHAPIERILGDVLGPRRLSTTTTAFMTHAYDIAKGTVRFFKNHAFEPACSTRDYLMKDVARAAPAAPTYFRPAVIRDLAGGEEEHFIDGGIFANNPAMIAYMEARRLFGGGRRIVVVSVGCGAAAHGITVRDVLHWGAVGWLINPRPFLLHAIMDGQSDNVDHHLAELLGRGRDYFRFDPALPAACEALDDCRNLEELHAAGEGIVREQADSLATVARLLVEKLKNQATPGAGPAPLPGQAAAAAISAPAP